jgi:DNA-binding LacI/PurR family transcriptional regulator
VELGGVACELLAAMVVGGGHPRSTLLVPELVVRGSTAVPADPG